MTDEPRTTPLARLKRLRESSARILADMKAHPGEYDALGVIRNQQGFLVELDHAISGMKPDET